ncbi:MAG: hypothetical protein DRP87_07175 [Spirochaetes bacterium]|nr:MAG: hypothetical protein DRP87_07175 [Spirochaetota bacterium]
MKEKLRNILYIALAILVLPAFYMIFNIGNPNSIVRLLVKDPSYDIAITVGICFIIFLFGALLSRTRTGNSLETMLDTNTDNIRKLRAEGKSNEEIARSFLNSLGTEKGGILYRMAFRRVIRYLEKMD